MKVLQILFFIAFVLIACKVNAQSYDLVVRSNGDSIICNIDSITADAMYITSYINGKIRHTFLSVNEVDDYVRNYADKSNVKAVNGRFVIKKKNEVRSNSIYFEFGGIGLFWSQINYDKLIFVKEKVALIPRIGLSYYEADEIYFVYEINFVLGGNKHYLETGFGQYTGGVLEGEYMLRAGYRYHGNGGFLFRIAPQYYRQQSSEDSNHNANRFWFGLSLGYCF